MMDSCSFSTSLITGEKSNIVIKNCVFSGNILDYSLPSFPSRSFLLFSSYFFDFLLPSLHFTNSGNLMFINNTFTATIDSSALSIDVSSNVSIYNNTFYELSNEADSQSDLFAVKITNSETIRVEGNTFKNLAGNTPYAVGAISVQYTNVVCILIIERVR